MKYNKWEISRQVLMETEQAFRSGQHEVFVIWPAKRAEAEKAELAKITRCIVPEQTPGVKENGVWVHIAGQELQRIQLDNFRCGERSVVQLHTHPGADVQMSALDREWEVVRHIGALSIIVPFYGLHDLESFAGVNVYEREEDDWRLWTRKEVMGRLVVS